MAPACQPAQHGRRLVLVGRFAQDVVAQHDHRVGGENGQDLLAQFAQRRIAFLGCQTLGVGARLLTLRRRLIHVHRFDLQKQA